VRTSIVGSGSVSRQRLWGGLRRIKYTGGTENRLFTGHESNMKICLRTIPWACVSLLLLNPAAHGQAPEGPLEPQPGVTIQQKPNFQVQTVLVNTPVTVRDARGEMVHNLEVKDFHVTDNGVTQKISHFDLGSEPLSIVIVVETSSRLTTILPEIRRTGTILTQTVMGPSGEAAIVGFNDEVEKLQDFTTNADDIETKITRLKEGTSGAKLYDAMAAGVEMLSGRPGTTATQAVRRRVMLVIAEASDVGSEAKLGEVLRRAQLENVTIYSVGISTARAGLTKKPEYKRPIKPTPDGTLSGSPPPGTVQTPTTEDNRYSSGGDAGDLLGLAMWAVMHAKDQITQNGLEIATTATGGAHMATWKNRSIEKAIDEVGGELHSQYMLTYTPVGTDENGYHEIKVDVDRKELKVRARPGYYLGAPVS
jgi:VWFA-related protein